MQHIHPRIINVLAVPMAAKRHKMPCFLHRLLRVRYTEGWLLMSTPKGTRPWNAGTSKGWVDKRGYRWLYIIDNGKRRARREHRVLMERHIGRRLEPWELVHHKDGNKSNNAISNLEIQQWDEHTRLHLCGTRRPEGVLRTIEGVALMREELKHARNINAQLLVALEAALAYINTSNVTYMGDQYEAQRKTQYEAREFVTGGGIRAAIAAAKEGK